MLMTRFKGVADFLDIVARGKFRGNLAKRMGIEISANLKVSSGISFKLSIVQFLEIHLE